MRATGIIRRIDDIGRVVIPKEIRRAMHISEGEPLEIYTDKDMVCFKKYKEYEPNYELMFQVVAALFDVAGVYDQHGELKRVGAGFTLDMKIVAPLDKVSDLGIGCILIPIVDKYKDTVALIAVDGKHACEAETIKRLAEATLVGDEE